MSREDQTTDLPEEHPEIKIISLTCHQHTDHVCTMELLTKHDNAGRKERAKTSQCFTPMAGLSAQVTRRGEQSHLNFSEVWYRASPGSNAGTSAKEPTKSFQK